MAAICPALMGLGLQHYGKLPIMAVIIASIFVTSYLNQVKAVTNMEAEKLACDTESLWN